MELSVAMNLIKPGISNPATPQVWADLGSGSGLFTKALQSILTPSSTIFAVDKKETLLEGLKSEMGTSSNVSTAVADIFSDELPIGIVDGVVIANTLHFFSDPQVILKKIKAHLKTEGSLIVVEYDLKRANPWVPFPIPLERLTGLTKSMGFNMEKVIGRIPSRYNESNIYSCLLKKVGRNP